MDVPVATNHPRQARFRVLVVDDDKDLGSLICEYLELAGGFTTTRVEDGTAALDFCRCDCPDLVIMDYSMPGMDGLQTLSLLRHEGHAMPVIIVSGNPIREVALRSGADAFLAKPFRLERLAAEIELMLNHQPQP
jgi:CheY-like chemotaxis protein